MIGAPDMAFPASTIFLLVPGGLAGAGGPLDVVEGAPGMMALAALGVLPAIVVHTGHPGRRWTS